MYFATLTTSLAALLLTSTSATPFPQSPPTDAFSPVPAGVVAPAPHAVPPVNTTTGTVTGRAAAWPASAHVAEYLGIPYAEPPVGPLRFKKPVKLAASRDVRGDAYANGCYQMVDMAGINASYVESFKLDPHLASYSYNMAGGYDRTYGEDCLALNVWTTASTASAAEGSTAEEKEKKAVMIWIYGGAFTSGDSAAHYYNGARLAAEQDVVVASINYRVGVFGFSGAPGEDQNVGLYDQRLAIEWLRDNIARFGGDPERMTIFGESAGGASVDFYTYAWTADPIIHGFIAQSGTAAIRPNKLATARDSSWYNFTQLAGCGGVAKGVSTVECMRKLPVEKIVGANLGAMLRGVNFGPLIDEKVVFSDYEGRARRGEFIKRPMLVGSTDQEGALTGAMAKAGIRGYASSTGGITGFVLNSLLSLYATVSSLPVPSLSSSANSSSSSSDGGFDRIACGSGPAAAARVAAGIPAWRYRYFGSWANLEIYPGAGAYHSADVPVVFGTQVLNRLNMSDTPAEARFVENMMTAWAAFAKDPDAGLQRLGWPVYDEGKSTLVKLAFENNPEPVFDSPQKYDANCKVGAA